MQTRLSFLCSTNQEPQRVIFSSLNQSKARIILSPKPIQNLTRLLFSHSQWKVLNLRFPNQSKFFSSYVFFYSSRYFVKVTRKGLCPFRNRLTTTDSCKGNLNNNLFLRIIIRRISFQGLASGILFSTIMGESSSSPSVFVFEIHLKKVFDVDLSHIIHNVSGVKLRNISTRKKHSRWKFALLFHRLWP